MVPSPSTAKLCCFHLCLLLTTFQELVVANLRCYSCAPCTEFDYSSGWRDPGQWEMDCPLDRYCFKITGQVSNHWPSCCIPSCIVLISMQVVDQYGYGQQVNESTLH